MHKEQREKTQTNQERETRQDYFIVRPPAHYNRSEHSGNSNSHGSNDGLKLSFLVLKALKTKVDNFSMVLANNKENLNMDGCLWYFGGISSSLKAVYFGHTNKKNVLLFLAYYRMDNLYPCREHRIHTVGNDILMQTFQF